MTPFPEAGDFRLGRASAFLAAFGVRERAPPGAKGATGGGTPAGGVGPAGGGPRAGRGGGAPRRPPMILQGASPRATLALTAMAKAAALVRGRDYVLPEDVSLVFGDVVPHRLLLSPRAEADRSFDPVSELLERVPAPRIS